MTWKRKYLKYKVEEEDFPQRLSMRRSAKYGNCNWTPGIWGHSSKLHMMYVKLDKFLKSRVGQSFDKVFSEFKSKFPDFYAGRNLVESFKNSFIEYQDRHWNGKYNSFYVENGIIKDGYKKPQKPKTAKINIRSKEKQKELERELLLHDLLQERKKKEKEENELIRDRHGFDDHSFKNW